MGERIRRGPVRHTQWRQVPADRRPELDLLAWVGWIIGGGQIVFGLVALSRAGFDDFDLYEPVVSMGPFSATRLMALIMVALGLILWIGTFGNPDEMGLRIIGAIMLVAGIVWIIEPSGFQEWLGITADDGWHFAVDGAVIVAASFTQPIRIGRQPPEDE